MDKLNDPKIALSAGVIIGVVVTSAAKSLAFLALPVAAAVGGFYWIKSKRKTT